MVPLMSETKNKSMTGVEREWLLSELEYKGSCLKKKLLKKPNKQIEPPPPRVAWEE